MAVHARTPVLVGVGQAVNRWGGQDAAQAPSPGRLAAEAAGAALRDCGAGDAMAQTLDSVFFVRSMLDSIPGAQPPFPQCGNLPRALADDLGLGPVRAVYAEVGGDQPQTLVEEAAGLIFSGQANAVLIAGAEATAAMKTAARAGRCLDWRRPPDDRMEDRGFGPALLSPYEIANGLGPPSQTYPAFEHALRARLGFGRDVWRHLMSELWAGFSEVAATNPHAQFPRARTAGFLAEASAENYPVADPYLKWHVAQDAVNQGAAVILTSVAQADAMGIPPARRVHLHGAAHGRDRFVTERPDLSRSRLFELVLAGALAAARIAAPNLRLIDLYSCFPCAVLLAAEALGVDWRTRPLTVTGGLPFFGGPGNSYSLHAIATMVERLRAAPGTMGLVLANGGFLSKAAAGVYSTSPVQDWAPCSSVELQAELDAQPRVVLSEDPGPARVETYTVTWRRGVPEHGYIIGTRPDGSRVLARAASAQHAALLAEDPIGRTVNIECAQGINLFTAPHEVDPTDPQQP